MGDCQLLTCVDGWKDCYRSKKKNARSHHPLTPRDEAGCLHLYSPLHCKGILAADSAKNPWNCAKGFR